MLIAFFFSFEGDEFAVITLKDVSGSAWTKLMNSDRYHSECAQFGGKSVAQGKCGFEDVFQEIEILF